LQAERAVAQIYQEAAALAAIVQEVCLIQLLALKQSQLVAAQLLLLLEVDMHPVQQEVTLCLTA
jgi:hypothetical protein